MRVLILTSSETGSGSYHLERLLKAEGIEMAGVVLSEGRIKNRRRHLKRKWSKALKVGLLGVLNGFRMRKWYGSDTYKLLNVRCIREVCDVYNVRLREVRYTNSQETRKFFRELNAEIGISLGNGYIASSVFSIPKYGMINVHHETLPEYQNAQSVIWQLYNGSDRTGYTIHKVAKGIDEGDILYRRIVPIKLHRSLAATVSQTYAELWKHSADGLVEVLKDLRKYFESAEPQVHGTKYTTPSIRQYFRIWKRHRRLFKVKAERDSD